MASATSSESVKIEPAVMASEIERLPDLEGFLKLASVPDWLPVKLIPIGESPVLRPRKPLAATSSGPLAQETISRPARDWRPHRARRRRFSASDR
jgi:hypothetical protein